MLNFGIEICVVVWCAWIWPPLPVGPSQSEAKLRKATDSKGNVMGYMTGNY
jgi:hypothetical protein